MVDTQQLVIIGGGIVGVCAALTAAEAGAAVTVIERGVVGGEASGLNAGLIGGGGRGGRPTVETALRMGSRDRFVELADERGHDIGLDRTGILTLVRTDDEQAWASGIIERGQEQGLVYEWLDIDQLIEAEPAADPSLVGALFDPLGASAEPVDATLAFAAEARKAGATFRTDTTVVSLDARPDGRWRLTVVPSAARSEGDGPPATSGVAQDLATSGVAQQVEADTVVVAAGPWCGDIGRMVGIDIPIAAVRGQMWATGPRPTMFRHGIAAAESATFWASESPPFGEPPDLTERGGRRLTRHLYGRQRPNGEVVFGGDRVLGADKLPDEDGLAVNHAHVVQLLPSLGSVPRRRRWAGSMPFSLDGRPLIGAVPGRPGLFVAGGLASSGFGRGPMAGAIVASLATGAVPALDLAPVGLAGRVGVVA